MILSQKQKLVDAACEEKKVILLSLWTVEVGNIREPGMVS